MKWNKPVELSGHSYEFLIDDIHLGKVRYVNTRQKRVGPMRSRSLRVAMRQDAKQH